MNNKCIVTVSIAVLLVAAHRGSAQEGTTVPDTRMSFFVTSVGVGKGGNLGGLAGADRHCQALAESVGAGERTWRAYLSTSPMPGQPTINARDRIGKGPWYNERKAVVAKDLAELHGDTIELARLGNNVTKVTALTEKGETVLGLGDRPNKHDMLTGSKPDGTAYTDGVDRTCSNWTSSAKGGGVQVGHSDRMGGGNMSWNSTHIVKGCSPEDFYLEDVHGALFYCFAAD
jgi:hypothetical protein